MSDSGKLRLTYGIVAYISSFFDLAAILILSLLCGFKILQAEFVVLIFLLSIGFVILLITALSNFIAIYYIGKKEGQNNSKP